MHYFQYFCNILHRTRNEAPNSIIWKKCPKNIFVNRDIEMGLCSVLINYNDGTQGNMKYAGLNIGALSISASVSINR